MAPPSLQQYGALPVETLTGVFKAQGPPNLSDRSGSFLLLRQHDIYCSRTSKPISTLQSWLRSGVIKDLSDYGPVVTNIKLAIKHDPEERKFMREDGLQREAVHA